MLWNKPKHLPIVPFSDTRKPWLSFFFWSKNEFIWSNFAIFHRPLLLSIFKKWSKYGQKTLYFALKSIFSKKNGLNLFSTYLKITIWDLYNFRKMIFYEKTGQNIEKPWFSVNFWLKIGQKITKNDDFSIFRGGKVRHFHHF